MSIQKQTTDVKPIKHNQGKTEPDVSVGQREELIGLNKLLLGLESSTDRTSVQNQARLLNDNQIPLVQRRMMAAQIGQTSGNQYLQRVILQREDLSKDDNLIQQASEKRVTFPPPSKNIIARAVSPHYPTIKKKLSYGIFDWAITDQDYNDPQKLDHRLRKSKMVKNNLWRTNNEYQTAIAKCRLQIQSGPGGDQGTENGQSDRQ